MKTEIQYLALLRGINVGGNNLIKMADLKACFEEMGFSGVSTYIQSGNVIFRSADSNMAKLTKKIEQELSQTFSYTSRIVLITQGQLEKAVEKAPPGFGRDPGQYRYDVIFLKEPFTPAEAMKHVTAREGVDQAFAGEAVLYFSRLISRASQSQISRIIGSPIYKELTIRNWNTTTKLLALMGK